MCTITYIPFAKDRFILTQNRDVRPNRYAKKIITKKIGDEWVMYPQDQAAGGTHLSTSDQGRAFCVMNGAFVPHKTSASYRLSRGIIALRFYHYPSAVSYFKEINLEDIEPFTMIAFEDGRLYEFRWDGVEKHLREKDPHAQHLWASCTLYNDVWQHRRTAWFDQWWAKDDLVTLESIWNFHQYAGQGDEENDLVMNRQDKVRTVSISMIEKGEKAMHLEVRSLITGKTLSAELPLTD